MANPASLLGEPRVDRLTLLAEIATRLLTHDRPEEGAVEVFERLAAHLDLDVFLNFVVSDDGAALRLNACAGIGDDAAASLARLDFHQGVCGTVAARREPIVAEHVQECGDPVVVFVRSIGVRAYACHPLLGRNGLVGTLGFGTRTRDTFTDDEIQVMRVVSTDVAIALERARTLDELNRELTERRRAEDALRASEERFRRVVEHIHDAVIVDDEAGRVIYANDRFLELFGFRREDVADLRLEDYVAPGYQQQLRSRHDRRIAGHPEPTRYEYEGVRRDGSRMWLEVDVVPIVDHDGRTTHTQSAIRDITERKRSEEALRDANARLADADRRKTEFLAVLSHELRNPLAPIRYALPLVQREALAEPGRRAMAVIDRQVAHLTRLVDDLLDISRITRDKISLRRAPVTVDAVVNAATEAASPLMVAARHEMTVTVPADPIWLYADAARLSQVVTNLLNNAARYTPRGGRISVQAGREGDRAVITVCDNGIGISPDALAGIFDLFMQAHGSEINEGGLGVGLALAKRLAEMHGGSIEAHSPGAGQGSAFIVRLPITQRDATSAVTDVEPPAARSAARLKVLIVDDSADLVEMLGLVVEGFGHDVRKTLDGRSAIAVALAYRPDVVLLDLGLPVISGEDVARELRRHPEMAATRLVALTGWGQAEDRRRTKDAGFDDHLTKPTDPRELQRLLADVARTR